MATKYIIGSVAASFAVAYVFDVAIADKKLFGGKYYPTYRCKQRMVERDRQKVPGMAAHCWSPGGHESHQPPKLHCQVLNEDIRSCA
ncbi:hypothetical protein RND71_036136 [Anisodus tanguticus]|uniref:Uncharacterized protein n=1 Tax=Anisodus tanguticus TaxID=243964 RepID=A0AAE1R6C3_9SOLA|nr:hypothetical protein RND71_036136 [Anisodus tanguticus]